MAHKTPKVRDNHLLFPGLGASSNTRIAIGSIEWFAWLEDHSAFVFSGNASNFTARCELRSGSSYWYAYRRHNGKLHKLYLGRTTDLTVTRLDDVAAQLAALLAEKQDNILPSTKFAPPYYTRMLVQRPRLHEKLDRAVNQRLILVSAAPGFGKTTLLAAWCAAQPDRRFAWVALDSGDNAPMRFWHSCLIALGHTYPGLGAIPLALRNASTALHSIPLESILTALINAVGALKEDIILILDDYQKIRAASVHDSLTSFLDLAPQNFHLILTSRADPPLPLMRWRAKGQLAEIRAADLQFDSGESEQFLKGTMGLAISTAQVEVLRRRTEGWIAGLLLAALSIPGSADVVAFLESFNGTERYIVDYLVSEILEKQPPEIQRFLLQTSILDRLCAPLAEALTELPDAQAVLEYLEHANLFLVALDHQRRWYRYHPLFADVLRTRLAQQSAPQVNVLHRRAAAWYASQRLLDEAIHHALSAHDTDDAADLMAKRAPSMLRQGEMAILLDWLTRLPEDAILARPTLGLSFAAALLADGRLEEGAQRISAIEHAHASALQQEPVPTWYGESAALHMLLAVIEGHTSEILRQAQLALQFLPRDDLFMRGFITWALAAAQFLTDGDVVKALWTFNQAVAANRAAGNLIMLVWALYSRSTFEALNGHLHQAAQTCQESLQVSRTENAISLPMAALGYLGLGDLLREWNRLDEAEHHLLEGLQLGRAWAATELLVDGTIALARLRQAQGKSWQALAALDEIEALMGRQSVSFVTRQTIAAYRTRFWLWQGNFQAAQNWVQQITEQDACGQRKSYSPWLIEIEDTVRARTLIAGGHAGDALQMLDGLASMAESAGQITNLIELRILQSMATKASGSLQAALAYLQQAVRLAEPEGYIRVFADEGAALTELLRALAKQSSSGRGYLERVLAAIEKDYASPNQVLPEPLTDRELEILQLIAAGYSNQDIAAALVLGLSTVKWHISNLLGKLDVNRREQAVRRAQDLGML